METMTEHPEPSDLGEALRQARVAAGFTQESLARELRLPAALIQAIETQEWHRIPPGRERPLTRLVARRLNVDLEAYAEAFASLPGGQGQRLPDPKRERLERILTGAISLASVALLFWLVVPGKDLRDRLPTTPQILVPSAAFPMALSKADAGPYPVLGEVLPEAPVTEAGILVSLRAMDTCEARIEGENTDLRHSMRISEPWTLRVKGPFTLTLDNAGVVALEVAGRVIPHGCNVGEPWTGTFGEDGAWQLPVEKRPKGSSAPDVDPETSSAPDADPETSSATIEE